MYGLAIEKVVADLEQVEQVEQKNNFGYEAMGEGEEHRLKKYSLPTKLMHDSHVYKTEKIEPH
jgi:hypothetical protein